MKIKRVQIKNYRNLKDVDVTLDNLTALIGENNSGKSNFLRAITLPLTSDDTGISKRLSWYDINKDAKTRYYNFITTNRDAIIAGTLSLEQFLIYIPSITVTLYLEPNENEHYDISDILCHDNEQGWHGGIQYSFYVKRPEELIKTWSSVIFTIASFHKLVYEAPVDCRLYFSHQMLCRYQFIQTYDFYLIPSGISLLTHHPCSTSLCDYYTIKSTLHKAFSLYERYFVYSLRPVERLVFFYKQNPISAVTVSLAGSSGKGSPF